MLGLVKQNIHMNRWKNKINTQVTLDDDFIVPDTMDDISRVILDSGEILLEPVKTQSEKVMIRGKLDFRVLFRSEEGSLQTLGGQIPFEETVNVPELEERDYLSVTGQLEDLKTEMIHSRKLGIRAIVTLSVKSEVLYDAEAAVEIEEPWAAGESGSAGTGNGRSGSSRSGGSGIAAADSDSHGGSTWTADSGLSDPPQIEVQKKALDVAAIALRKKDTCRIREEEMLPGSKPAIDRVLWTEMRLGSTSVRAADEKVLLEGSLLVFVIYVGEGENLPIQYHEESIPFSGEIEMPGAGGEMIPAVDLRLIHKGLEAKPDYDGEMRQLDVDAVIELDIRLYEEQHLEVIGDLYATNRELSVETQEACFDRILTRNTGKCKISEKVELESADRILQICHSSGSVKLDETRPEEGVLALDGVLEVKLLYLTDDDAQPVQSATQVLPFHYEAEAPGITQESIWYLDTGVEQLSVMMSGGNTAEIRAVLALNLLVLEPVCQPMIQRVEMTPPDLKKLQQLPGIVGYLVQPGEQLWDIAKRFHTTIDNIILENELTSETVQSGDCLILVKEIAR